MTQSMKNLLKTLLMLLGIASVYGLVVLVWRVPQWNVPASVIDEKERAELINANREIVFKGIQTVAGLGFVATAYLAWRNSQLTEDKNVTERFSKAVEMLADEKLEIRLGGIYSLERIAKDSKEDHPVVMEVLSAFIRESTYRSPKVSSYIVQFVESQKGDESSPQRIKLDVQSALSVIGRRKANWDVQRIDLFGASLYSANLTGLNLSNVTLTYADLRFARLAQTNLENAELIRTNFKGCTFENTKFCNAVLSATDLSNLFLHGCNLSGADLLSAVLTGSDLSGTNLRGANFSSANLSGVDLFNADLRSANLSYTNLSSAWMMSTDLRNVKGLRTKQLTEGETPYLCGTRLPSYITGLDCNRDCDKMATILASRGSGSAFHKTLIDRLVKSAKRKRWF